MALSDYALVTPTELKTYRGAEGSDEDARLTDAINRATFWLEGETNRKFITRGSVTEYHSTRGQSTIQLSQWPLISVTSIHESTASPRAYDSGSLLTADTDYVMDAETGQVHRLRSSELSPWATGRRAIKVVFDYGYADTDAVPEDLKLLALFVASGIYTESDRKRWGVSSVTDAQGSVTRFLGYLPPDMRAHLEMYRRRDVDRTWEAA